MSVRRFTIHDCKTFRIQLQPIAAILWRDVLFPNIDLLHQIVRNTLFDFSIGLGRNFDPIRRFLIFPQRNSLRGCFASATIAEAGGAAGLSGGGARDAACLRLPIAVSFFKDIA